MQPQLPEWVWYTDRLSEKRIVVRYDPRGRAYLTAAYQTTPSTPWC